jgi:hypothetical protein
VVECGAISKCGKHLSPDRRRLPKPRMSLYRLGTFPATERPATSMFPRRGFGRRVSASSSRILRVQCGKRDRNFAVVGGTFWNPEMMISGVRSSNTTRSLNKPESNSHELICERRSGVSCNSAFRWGDGHSLRHGPQAVSLDNGKPRGLPPIRCPGGSPRRQCPRCQV